MSGMPSNRQSRTVLEGQSSRIVFNGAPPSVAETIKSGQPETTAERINTPEIATLLLEALAALGMASGLVRRNARVRWVRIAACKEIGRAHV